MILNDIVKKVGDADMRMSMGVGSWRDLATVVAFYVVSFNALAFSTLVIIRQLKVMAEWVMGW